MTAMSEDELIVWATREAGRLRDVGRRLAQTDIKPGTHAHLETAAAIEFLDRSSPGSEFVAAARAAVAPGTSYYAEGAVDHVADMLEQWVAFVQSGLLRAQPFEVQARIEASTDLMEQVQVLLDDRNTHPAAAVVLAGAALEEFLRSRISARGLTITGKPGINTYAAALKTDGDLTSQELKEITAWAGQRNEAAHGQFENLSRQRAQIMVDGINLFIQKRTS